MKSLAVEIRDAKHHAGPLPFGLSSFDDLDAATNKLRTHFVGLSTGMVALTSQDGYAWNTVGFCIRNSSGALVTSYVVFDSERRLKTIGSRLDW